MASPSARRDYRITGPESEHARQKGLVSAEWYMSPVPRQRLKELMRRKDGPALRDTLIWFALLIGAGVLAWNSWGTWWAVPAFLLYGLLYTTPAESRWHECSHGTPFKTSWMNETLYQISSFMCVKPPTPLRWSHSRHHTDTIIVGVDPEIKGKRPPIWRELLLEFGRLIAGPLSIRRVILHCFGKLDDEEKLYIPEIQHRKTFWESRVWVLVYGGFIAWAVAIESFLPLMFVGLPYVYGSWMHILLSATQHMGLDEDVLDHRLNSRTFYTNRFIRFLYWNMNYHIEHHMYPMVPYFNLPALHEEIKRDCPPATPSFTAALKEVAAALWKQRKDPDYLIERHLPPSAQPYAYGPVSLRKSIANR